MRSRTPGRRESFLIFTGLPPKKVLVKVYWGDRKKERLSFRGNKEIADSLCISERTVKNHISNIFKKIDVSDRTQAAVFAIKNNIIKL